MFSGYCCSDGVVGVVAETVEYSGASEYSFGSDYGVKGCVTGETTALVAYSVWVWGLCCG